MIPIQQALDNILKAVYGKDVRSSIHDAIYQIDKNANEALDLAKIKLGNAVTDPTSPVGSFIENTIYWNTETGIIWQLVGGAWTDQGHLKSIKSISYPPIQDPTDSTGKTWIYTISFNDGSVFDYKMRDGADGLSINDIRPVTNPDPLMHEYEVVLSDNSVLPTHIMVRDGEDAFVPTLTVVKDTTTGKTTITAIDKNGTTTAEILDGKDAFVPTATVTKDASTGVTTITVVDKNGQTTADVNDGLSIVDVQPDGAPVGNAQQYKFILSNGATLPTRVVITSGTSAYVHVRYSANFDGSGMTNISSRNTPFIGFCATSVATAPTDPSLYQWVRFLGNDGQGTGDMSKDDFVTTFPGTTIVDSAAGLWDAETSTIILANQMMMMTKYATENVPGTVDKALALVDKTSGKTASTPVLTEFSDDGTGLKYKGAEIGGKTKTDDTTIKYVNEKLQVQIDDELKDNSELPVQNKVVKKALEDLEQDIEDDLKKEKVVTQLLASGWVGSSAPYTYDLSTLTPVIGYDLEILPPNTLTENEMKAVQKAQFASNADDNKLRAWGTKPTIDIPIVIRKEVAEYVD